MAITRTRNGLLLMNPRTPELATLIVGTYHAGTSCAAQSTVLVQWTANVYGDKLANRFGVISLTINFSGSVQGDFVAPTTIADIWTNTAIIGCKIGAFDSASGTTQNINWTITLTGGPNNTLLNTYGGTLGSKKVITCNI